MTVSTKPALREIAGQATVETTPQSIRFQIIVQAVRDLVPQSCPPDESDYPAEMYFQGKEFREDADWCGLSPEWVLEVLARHKLLIDGRRVQYVYAEFHAA